MNPERWDRLEALLERAEAIPASERAAFVDREAGDDAELRAELTTLIAASEGAGDYLSGLRDDLLGTGVLGLLREAPDADAAPDPWIGRTVSHYEILDRIGGGGMGVVYRARDVRLDRPVALKFIAPEVRRDAEARRRFLHEARAASALDHPNICTIHEIAETESGGLFMVMAAYEGETLRARVERCSLPDAEALDIGSQIARALAAAHERGIVHRDVKPENVFVTHDGVVKLLDFGLARTDDGWMSAAGGVQGTVAYMSPEQVRGQRADARSDVWALGVILFEMLAGARPFAADDARGILRAILMQDPDLGAVRPDLPPAVIEVVHRALAREPDRRFPDAVEVLNALGGTEAATVAPAPESQPRRRWRAWVGGGAAVTFAIVASLALRDRLASGSPAPAEPTTPTTRVLWVDDDPANNRFIIEQFAAKGVAVDTALTTAEALRRYDPGRHRLVISDMGRYEGANGAYVSRAGLQLLAALRARHRDAPVAFCTSARAVSEYRDEALTAGARDIVTHCEQILRLLGLEPDSPG